MSNLVVVVLYSNVQNYALMVLISIYIYVRYFHSVGVYQSDFILRFAVIKHNNMQINKINTDYKRL